MDSLANAKVMRSSQTPAEQRMWYHLRAHRFLGLKFKRQSRLSPISSISFALNGTWSSKSMAHNMAIKSPMIASVTSGWQRRD